MRRVNHYGLNSQKPPINNFNKGSSYGSPKKQQKRKLSTFCGLSLLSLTKYKMPKIDQNYSLNL
jgi:hypothetical protein